MRRIWFDIFEEINFFILKLKKNKKISLNDKSLGINLGSENNTIKEYIGIDGSFLIYIMKSCLPLFLKKYIYKKSCTSNYKGFEDFYKSLGNKKIVHFNLDYGIPLNSNSVRNIYTSHFLEHLNGKEGAAILEECYRCLKNKGILRIVVPDLEEETKRIEAAIKKYKLGDSDPIQEFLTVDRYNHNRFSFHQKIYSFKDLEVLLKKIGFKNIRREEFKKGNLPEVKRLEQRTGLIVEANK
ncbi:MAG: methyltransferase domain-containing protein [Candidatus Pacearchaeota archaeon]